MANEHFSESKNTSMMLGKEEFEIRNDVMRRNMVASLKQKHWQATKQKIVNEILK